MPFFTPLRFFVLSCILVATVVAQNAPRANYITGRTTKSDGSPLAGVELRIFGTTDAGQRSSLNTRSKTDGTFALRLPSGNFSLREAVWPVTHEGRQYFLPLHLEGEDNSDFDSTEGWNARLTLLMEGKVTARKADSDESAWFGGTIEIEWIGSDGRSADALPENATLKISLTPRGAHLDGSAARAHTYTRTVSWQRASRVITNVPLATYDAEASLVVGGKAIPLLVASREGTSSAQTTELGQRAPIRFAPKSGQVSLLTSSGVEKCVLQVVAPIVSRGVAAETGSGRPSPAPNPPTTSDAASQWKVGDHLDVLRSPHLGQWHPGTIIRTKPGLYLIKFDAFDEEFNEWVDASRLRPIDR